MTKVKADFEKYKKENPTKKEYDDLRKQLNILSQSFKQQISCKNVFQRSAEPAKQQNNLFNSSIQPSQSTNNWGNQTQPNTKQPDLSTIEKEMKELKTTQMKQQEYFDKILDGVQASMKAITTQATSINNLDNKMFNYFNKIDNRLNEISKNTTPSKNVFPNQNNFNNNLNNLNNFNNNNKSNGSNLNQGNNFMNLNSQGNNNPWNNIYSGFSNRNNVNPLSQSAVFDSKNNVNILNSIYGQPTDRSFDNSYVKLQDGYNIKYSTKNNLFGGKFYTNL